MAVPGSVVNVGKLVTPGGAQGPQGPSSGLPIGGIIAYAASGAPPNGWLACDGSAVSRTLYADLFAAIGTTYGAGNGSTTFTLPDSRGRTVVGAGQGTSLTNRVLAATGGEENHALSIAELAAHSHTINDPGHNHLLYQAVLATSGGGSYAAQNPTTGAYYSSGNSATGVTAQNTGSGTAHNTMMPFIVWQWIIRASYIGVTGSTPLADTTQNGLLKKVSGLTTDFVDGTNNCQSLTPRPVILGATAADPLFTGGIVVPSYAAHPDRLWTPYGQYDDHFDGSTLNAKWVQTIPSAGGINVSGSHVHLNAATPTSAAYTCSIYQSIPTGVDLAITLKLRLVGWATFATSAYTDFAIMLCGGTAPTISSGIGVEHYHAYSSAFAASANTNRSLLVVGSGLGTTLFDGFLHGEIPPYWRFEYTNSSKSSVIRFSFDGITWIAFSTGITGAQSAFSTTAPSFFRVYAAANISAFAYLAMDWFRVQ
jgi:microcystin-dependent protein